MTPVSMAAIILLHMNSRTYKISNKNYVKSSYLFYVSVTFIALELK